MATTKRVTAEQLVRLADLNHKAIDIDHELKIRVCKIGKITYYAKAEDDA